MPIVNGLQTIVNRSGEDLRGAVLREANLTRTDFTGTNLSGADLTGADLSFSVFNGANLTDADLRNANLTDADLVGAIKNNSEFVREYSIEGIPDIVIPLALQITNYDGDGYNHNNYVDNVQWQELKNEVWSDIAIDTGIYYTANYGEDQTIRALITYTDGEGFSQTVQSISKSFNLQNPIESSSSEIINVEPSQGLANESNTSQDNQTSSSNIISDNLQSSPQERLDQENVPQENNQENVENPAISIRDSLRRSTFEIRGTAKVGETMTVGYNLTETAVDADNASGALAGSYNYKWELSGDGGSSWTTVATNADYKITTADVDKKLRALVSYTDDGGFDYTDLVSTNSLDTVSLAEVGVDTNQSLIEYQYRLQKSGSDVDLGGVIAYSNDSNTNSAYGDISYDLIVEAKTLENGKINNNFVTWDLESFDITLDFNHDLFSNWDASGASVSFGDEVNNAKSYDYTIDALSADSVRITGATLSNVNGETGIQGDYKELFTLTGLKFDASGAKTFVDGGNQVIDVDIATNIYDTVVANYQSTDDDTVEDNAYIKSLAGLGYTDTLDSSGIRNDGGFVDDTTYKTYIHNAYVDLDEQGTTLYTQRYIGSSDKTYLIRDGSTVDAKGWWANRGTYGVKAEDLNLTASDTTNFKLMELAVGENGTYEAVNSYAVDTVTDLSGSDLIDGGSVDLSTGFDASGNANKSSWDGSGSENIELSFKVQVDGKVGQRLNELETDFYTLEGKDTDGYESTSAKLTNNIITFQGDLNYDGRVSMKDLAFLNAGGVAEDNSGNFSDVDANYDGKITASDLAILDRDWGGTIHSIATDEEWESKSWTSINYWDNDVINNISDTEVDFKNSAYDHQSTVDSLQGDPLAGDIYSGTDNQYEGGSTYNKSSSYFDLSGNSQAILGFEQTETFGN